MLQDLFSVTTSPFFLRMFGTLIAVGGFFFIGRFLYKQHQQIKKEAQEEQDRIRRRQQERLAELQRLEDESRRRLQASRVRRTTMTTSINGDPQRLANSLEQVFSGFEQAMEQSFSGFEQTIRNLERSAHNIQDARVGITRMTRTTPLATVTKKTKPKPEPEPEPKRLTRYEALLEDDDDF